METSLAGAEDELSARVPEGIPVLSHLTEEDEDVTGASAEERELVRRLIDGDAAAFEVFESRYIPAVYRFASAQLHDRRELIKDMVQTAICNAIENLDRFRGESSLLTWLCACCRNVIAGHFRREQSLPKRVELEESMASSEPSAEALAIESELTTLVHLALDHLPPHYADALEWKYIDGASVRDIGMRLQMSEKAAESLLTRARGAFRSAYDELRKA